MDDVASGRPAVAPAIGRHLFAAIGIDRYRDWRPLHNAVGDVRGAGELFGKLGFEEVIPPLLDDQATGKAIQALVTDELTSLDQNDSLIVFYAGHGGIRSQPLGGREVQTGYLIPVDAGNGRKQVHSWVELDPWLRRIAQLPPRHILVILDACCAGSALSSAIRWGRDSGTLAGRRLDALNARRSRRVITSTLDDQRAMDSGPALGHSLFTGCLIDALTGRLDPAGARNDGRLVTTGSDLGQHLRQRVHSYSGRPGWDQTPDHGTFDFDDRGEMLIPLLTADASSIAPASLARGSAGAIAAAEPTAGDAIKSEQGTVEPFASKLSAIEPLATEAVVGGAIASERIATGIIAQDTAPAGSEAATAVARSGASRLLRWAPLLLLLLGLAIALAVLRHRSEVAPEPVAGGDGSAVTGHATTVPAEPMPSTASAHAGGPRDESHVGVVRDPSFDERTHAGIDDTTARPPVPASAPSWTIDEHVGRGPPLTAIDAPVAPADMTAGRQTAAETSAKSDGPASTQTDVPTGAPARRTVDAPPRSSQRTSDPPASQGKALTAPSEVKAPAAAPRICRTHVASPKGAEVTWNGETHAVPVDLDLPCGVEVRLLFRRPYSEDTTRRWIASVGGKAINVRMTKKSRAVKISSAPPGATIVIGRRPVGRTPMTIELPEFETTAVTLTKDGHAPVVKKVTPTEDGMELRVELPPAGVRP